MNVFNRIREAKQKVKNYVDMREQKKAVRTAEQLAEMKRERIKLEGREKIYAIKEREQAKLDKAKMNLRKRTPAYRVINALKDNLKKNKGKRSFGNLPSGNVSGYSGSSQPSRFGGLEFLKKEEPKKPMNKKKGKSITIVLR